jgi:3-methyladenine DNA glycosylase AlkD
MTADEVKVALRALGSPERAKNSAWFFKTGKGQYGEGDEFIGVTVPGQRAVAKQFAALPIDEVEELLHSPEHEFRLTALIIWVNQYRKAGEALRAEIFKRYLANTKWINNWDLVDSSAYQIVGAYLEGRDKTLLSQLARSSSLWERRIAVLSTFYYIQHGQAEEALKIAEILLQDKEDLIQKAVGWMLREIGKKCGQQSPQIALSTTPVRIRRRSTTFHLRASSSSRTLSTTAGLDSGKVILEKFLKKHYKTMPRTMLRYAIEHFEPEKRAAYLKGQI